MNQLHFTQEQLSKILDDFVKEEKSTQALLKLALEALMRAERKTFKLK